MPVAEELPTVEESQAAAKALVDIIAQDMDSNLPSPRRSLRQLVTRMEDADVSG